MTKVGLARAISPVLALFLSSCFGGGVSAPTAAPVQRKVDAVEQAPAKKAAVKDKKAVKALSGRPKKRSTSGKDDADDTEDY